MKYQHTIKHNPLTQRWSCACGYTLGDGREAFLAPCPAKVKAAKDAKKAARKKPTKKAKHL